MFESTPHLHALSKIFNNLRKSSNPKHHPDFEILGAAIFQTLSHSHSSSLIHSMISAVFQQLNEQQFDEAIRKCVLILETRCQDSSANFIVCIRRLAQIVGRRIKLHPRTSKGRWCMLFGPKNSQKSIHVSLTSQMVSLTSQKPRIDSNAAASSYFPLKDQPSHFELIHSQLKNIKPRPDALKTQFVPLDNVDTSEEFSEDTDSDSIQNENSFESPRVSEPLPLSLSKLDGFEVQLNELFQSRRQQPIVKRKVIPLYR
jgi:hypothetical protein